MTAPAIDGPLAGVTVVDLTRVLAGPFCTLTLADLGARVIKVEHPGGDMARQLGPMLAGNVSGYALSVNRGKQSIALDLKRTDDVAVLQGCSRVPTCWSRTTAPAS